MPAITTGKATNRLKHSIPMVRMNDGEATKKAELLDSLVKAAKEGLDEADRGILKAALAIKDIRGAKLWPQNMSWPQFLLNTFDISEERAKQLISFVEVRDSIQGKVLPENERQTRALRRADEDQRQSVWERAIKKCGGQQPTATLIESLVKSDEKKRRTVAEVERKQEAPERKKTEREDDLPGFDDADEHQPDDAPPCYHLTVKLTVGGTSNLANLESMLREHFDAERTNVRIAHNRLGMKFKCQEADEPTLLDVIRDLLNDDIESLRLEIEKEAIAVTVAEAD